MGCGPGAFAWVLLSTEVNLGGLSGRTQDGAAHAICPTLRQCSDRRDAHDRDRLRGGSGSSGSDSGSAGGADAPKIAAVFSGTTTDADYTFLGLQALQSAEKEFGARDHLLRERRRPRRRARDPEYVADGNTVVWTPRQPVLRRDGEGGEGAPDVAFIAEQDTQPADVPDNVWVLDRNFHLAFYPLGVLAGATTKSGKIAYLGGATLPFSYSEVHAVEQALKDSGLERHAHPGVDR